MYIYIYTYTQSRDMDLLRQPLDCLPSGSSCFESGQELQLAEVRDLADRIEFAV